MPGLSEGIHRLLDTIYPPQCVVCQRMGAVVCAQCLNSMHPPAAPTCPHCGETILNAGYSTPDLCSDCAAGRGPIHLDGVRVAAAYTGAARTAVLALKFGGER